MNIDVDVQELKQNAPLIPYIKNFYSDKVIIENESKNVAFAKCVFHKENTASLAFYANGTYKCFGCGEHGDIITFVQKMEHVDFQNACIIIANNIGYELKELHINQEWEKYKDELDERSRRYWVNLRHNAEAFNYIVNVRSINQETINTFRLGCTDVNEFKYRNDIGNISNRIVFPILEHKKYRPKCVGMAYRTLYDEKPKYINDHNQVGKDGQNKDLNGVFIKGNMLYGLAQAYSSIYKNDFVFVVEGYFDVISMYQSGFTNTIGIMGTSLTKEQILAIKKLTSNVLLLLDNDNAGIKAMEKYVQELIKYGIKPMICIIDGYNDPDEMCRDLNFNTKHIRDFMFRNVKDGLYSLMLNHLDNYKSIVFKERVKVFTKLYSIIDTIPDMALKIAYLKEMEEELYS